MVTTAPPDLSVVVASVESSRILEQALSALCASGAGLEIEVWVVDGSRDDSARRARAFGPPVRVIEREPGTLVPSLWAEGIRRSTGSVVALTTGHCVVPRDWAPGLVEAVREGAAAAGAGIVPLPSARALDCAICYLRYAGFLETTRGGRRPVEDLPGDNVAYAGPSLRDFVQEHPEGFWELDYHRELHARGQALWAVPAATAGFGRSYPFGTILHHRFEHGRRFGASRARSGAVAKARVVVPAPLVPLVLLARAGRQALRFPEHRRRFLSAVPSFVALATAWAAGEAIGALVGVPSTAGDSA